MWARQKSHLNKNNRVADFACVSDWNLFKAHCSLNLRNIKMQRQYEYLKTVYSFSQIITLCLGGFFFCLGVCFISFFMLSLFSPLEMGSFLTETIETRLIHWTNVQKVKKKNDKINNKNLNFFIWRKDKPNDKRNDKSLALFNAIAKHKADILLKTKEKYF